MTYTHVDEVPRRSQWEANSSPNQPYNCGPTSVAFVADFYRDATFGIEATRDLAHLVNGDGTSAAEQSEMLADRGVPNSVQQPTAAQLTALVENGLRPVVIGMLMSSVPAAIRGHSFPGVHAVAVRRNTSRNGVPGKLIMDPNFGYGHTPDETNGFRFYPDTVVEAARNGANRHAIVPSAEKEIPMTPGVKQAGKPIGTLTFAGGSLISTIDIAKRYPRPAGTIFAVLASLDLKRPDGKPVDVNGNTPPLNNRDQVYLVDDPSFGIAAYALRSGGTFTPAVLDVEGAKKQAAHEAAADVAQAATDAAANYP